MLSKWGTYAIPLKLILLSYIASLFLEESFDILVCMMGFLFFFVVTTNYETHTHLSVSQSSLLTTEILQLWSGEFTVYCMFQFYVGNVKHESCYHDAVMKQLTKYQTNNRLIKKYTTVKLYWFSSIFVDRSMNF